MEDLSIKELENILVEKKKVTKKKKRLSTEKKALYIGMGACIILILFSMAMVVMDKDTQTVAIFAGTGVVAITVIFGIYEKHSTAINLKHMEENYIVDYDEKEGIR